MCSMKCMIGVCGAKRLISTGTICRGPDECYHFDKILIPRGCTSVLATCIWENPAGNKLRESRQFYYALIVPGKNRREIEGELYIKKYH